MILKPTRDRGCHLERRVDAAVVVVHEEQGDCVSVILGFLAVGVREPDKSLICMRIVKLCLSTWLVHTCSLLGMPIRGTFFEPLHLPRRVFPLWAISRHIGAENLVDLSIVHVR